MSENLKELIFFEFDWDEDETRGLKLALRRANHGLEYVRHEPIPNKPKYACFSKRRTSR